MIFRVDSESGLSKNQKKRPASRNLGPIVFFVDPEISAHRLVDSSRFAVVQPFSSVGLYESKKADICFYDPLRVLRDGHPSALGGNFCIGSENLNSWFEARFREWERTH